MSAAHRRRPPAAALVLSFATLAGAALPAAAAARPVAAALEAERASVNRWRMERVESLTGDDGWLTLAGLYWLKQGDNSFGRAPGNSLVLDNAALPDTAGKFVLSGQKVRFIAHPGAHVTHDGAPVTALDMSADTAGEPTTLASGPLRFFVIERAGNLGVRVRDLDSPHRLQFLGDRKSTRLNSSHNGQSRMPSSA